MVHGYSEFLLNEIHKGGSFGVVFRGTHATFGNVDVKQPIYNDDENIYQGSEHNTKSIAKN